MLIVLASLHFFNYWYFQTSKVSKDSSGNGVLESKDLHQKRATAYVIGLLLDQGEIFILYKQRRQFLIFQMLQVDRI